MIDILADDAARWPAFGRANSLEIDRPAAVTVGADRAGGNSWAFGFTPSRLVGVWMGNTDGRPAQSADALNGAAPVWNAVMRYAHATLPRESWPRPPEVAQLDVCDPSGMLPTVYCPTVVRELFLQGTEPTHYDTLYQPYRINRETGKLATLFTPAKMVEERVFLVPPPEAADWAEQAGIARPPGEYDTLIDLSPGSDGVRVTSPAPFDYVRGEVAVWGEADIPEMDFYRIQIGQGLNPSQWIQVGGDQTTAVKGGELGRWDTAGMDGLQALQLVVVAQDGTLRTASVPVTVDNAPPKIEFLSPLESGEDLITTPLLLEARVEDEVGVALVEFLVDGVVQASLKVAPFSARLERLAQGAHTLAVRATDLAGNQVTSPGFEISVGPG
jgi:hypothetical protein